MMNRIGTLVFLLVSAVVVAGVGGPAAAKTQAAEGERLLEAERSSFMEAPLEAETDHEKIAFHSNRDGNYEIYVMNADGTGQTRLTNDAGTDTAPSFSPDGSKIAFSSDRDGNDEIYVMNVDGSDVTRLTNRAEPDSQPDWSPDGTKIAFFSQTTNDEGPTSNLFVMNADGSGVQQLTDFAYSPFSVYYHSPSWSPNGTQIAFTCIEVICLINADGSGYVVLDGGLTFDPDWSPDGSRLVVWRVDYLTNERDVYTMSAGGGDFVRLTTSGGEAAVWSGDGTKIAFTSSRDGNSEIYVMNVDGSEQTRLTVEAATDGAPSWWPAASGPATYTISGRVTDGSSNGVPSAAVSTNTGDTATTDADGYYTIADVVAGGYVVTPSLANYTFTPSSQAVTVPPDASGVDFVAAGEETYSISGQVTDLQGGPFGYADVHLGGTITKADAQGQYTISGLAPGTYSVAVTYPGFAFTPIFRTVTVPPDAEGMDFTGWEGTTSVVIDNGFDVANDGYSFSNSWITTPGWLLDRLSPDFGIAEMRLMFGDEDVCRFVDGDDCVPRWDARLWMDNANTEMHKGHCYGMAVTASEYFEGLDTPSRLDDDAEETFDLGLGDSRRNISYHMVMQWTGPIRTRLTEERRDTAEVVAKIMAELAAERSPLLGLYPEQGGGHAVTAYRVEEEGNGQYVISVYDNNHPDESRDIHVSGEEWSYVPWDGGFWSGGNGSTTTVSAADHDVDFGCPWCVGVYPPEPDGAAVPLTAGEAQLWFEGGGHLLITNSGEQQLGYRDGALVNEIPGAMAVPIMGGVRMDLEPVYSFPLTDTYEIVVDGATVTTTVPVTVTQFSPRYTAAVAGVELAPGTADDLAFLTEPGIAYTAAGMKDVDLTLIVDGATAMHELGVKGVDLAPGDALLFDLDVGEGKSRLQHTGSRSGSYVVTVERIDSHGVHQFESVEVPMVAGATHYVSYGEWDGAGYILLEIDADSDGTVESEMVLRNETMDWVFLPMLKR